MIRVLIVALLLVLVPRHAIAQRWPHGDPNVVIRSILAQPAYRQAGPLTVPATSLLERFLTWIGNGLHRLFGSAKIPPGAVKATADAALLLLLAALAWFGFVAYRFIVRSVGKPVKPGASGGQRGLDSPATATELRARAARAAEAGDYAFAIALLFRAALTALDECSLVAYDAARTPGEYRRLVRRTIAAAAAPFDELTARFVRASFGRTAADWRDYEAAAGAFDAFGPLAAQS